MKPVRLHSLARQEIRDGVAYHEAEREGYGERFEDEIRSYLERIGRQPKLFPPYKVFEGQLFRKCVVRKFKYLIFFLELDRQIWVPVVMHGKRKPDYWIDRSPDDA